MTNPRDLSKYVPVDVSSTRLNRVWASVAVRLPAQGRSHFRLWAMLAATLIVCVAFVTWRLTLRSETKFLAQGAVVETASDTSTVELHDGSRLQVGVKTRMEWAARDGHSTIVKLARGSLACDVVPNHDRRFTVMAADVRVEVTGTRFSVSYSPESEHIEVAVQRGSVSITANGATPERTLLAGERWSADRGASRPAGANSVARLADTTPSSAPSLDSAATPAPQESVVTASDAATSAIPDLPTAHALMDQGNLARRKADVRGAANAYEALLTRFPRDPRAGLAAFELGRLRMGPLADIPGAVRAFQTAIAHSPGSAIREDSMAHLVEAYAASGQHKPCAAARDTYLNAYPNGVHVALVRRQCSTP